MHRPRAVDGDGNPVGVALIAQGMLVASASGRRWGLKPQLSGQPTSQQCVASTLGWSMGVEALVLRAWHHNLACCIGVPRSVGIEPATRNSPSSPTERCIDPRRLMCIETWGARRDQRAGRPRLIDLRWSMDIERCSPSGSHSWRFPLRRPSSAGEGLKLWRRSYYGETLGCRAASAATVPFVVCDTATEGLSATRKAPRTRRPSRHRRQILRQRPKRDASIARRCLVAIPGLAKTLAGFRRTGRPYLGVDRAALRAP